MPFQIIRNDITNVKADVIVNSANPIPTYAGAVDRSIYLAAGANELLLERRKIGVIPVGEAAVTPAFNLPAKYIIHTVGPVWIDGEHGEVEAVRSCYQNSLRLASELKCESIAFPLISTGAYGFPKDKALEAATSVIYQFLLQNEMMVYLVIYDQTAFDYSSRLFTDVREFIDQHYIEDQEQLALEAACKGDVTVSGPIARKAYSSGLLTQGQADRLRAHRQSVSDRIDYLKGEGLTPGETERGHMASLEEMLETGTKSFGDTLMEMIAERGLTNSEVYRASNISKQTFSNIRKSGNPPKRETVAALAIGMRLTVREAERLYEAAGYVLTRTSKFDVCIRYFLINGQYNIVRNNLVLDSNGLPLLGSSDRSSGTVL